MSKKTLRLFLVAFLGMAPTSPAWATARATPSQPGSPAGEAEALRFVVDEGLMQNHFFRQGPVAAHVSARAGRSPRLVVAFPAGNAGAGLWFAEGERPVTWRFESEVAPAHGPGDMRGVTLKLATDAAKLAIDRAILGGIRFLRTQEEEGALPKDFLVERHVGKDVAFQRLSFDGRHHYALRITPAPGTAVTLEGENVVLRSMRGVAFTLAALTDESPLTPIPRQDLWGPEPADATTQRLRQALEFLSYEEKVLAGSWRFLTYFGRDTLLSLAMLMPAIKAEFVEAGLRAVLERVNDAGEVAHEEAIGDWAAYESRGQGRKGANPDPEILDYKMVDDNFLLTPVAAAYLLPGGKGAAQAKGFLAKRTPAGRAFGDVLARNVRLVIAQALPYARSRSPRDLIALKPGEVVGDWRDSHEGLAHGLYSFSTNAAFVPAALRAARDLLASGLLDAFMGAEKPRLAGEAGDAAEAWQDAHRRFFVTLDAGTAWARAKAYAAKLGLAFPLPAPESRKGTFAFYGVSLEKDGKPIGIENSDVGLVMLLNDPAAPFLEYAMDVLTAPFPLGLKTPVGYVVANPALADDPKLAPEFTTRHYHGTVVWSWQHAALLLGVQRQLSRGDLAPTLRERLRDVEAALRDVIRRNAGHMNEELWTFRVDHGRMIFAPFGQERDHASESNAVQLWSTVFLGIAY